LGPWGKDSKVERKGEEQVKSGESGRRRSHPWSGLVPRLEGMVVQQKKQGIEKIYEKVIMKSGSSAITGTLLKKPSRDRGKKGKVYL